MPGRGPHAVLHRCTIRLVAHLRAPQLERNAAEEQGTMNRVAVRLYGRLNDFLPRGCDETALVARFAGPRSVKDLIEGFGVPHPEIDLVLVNGESVSFEHALRDGDRVAAFPSFCGIDISAVTRVRGPELPVSRFILDGHLGKLARLLRLVGLDASCPPGAEDHALAATAADERRILLTRDRESLKRSVVVHGYLVRETNPGRQIVEVLQRYGPLPLRPFSRCLRCNTELHDVKKSAVEDRLPPGTREHFQDFRACDGCGRIYWPGSHWRRLVEIADIAARSAWASDAAGPPALPTRSTQSV